MSICARSGKKKRLIKRSGNKSRRCAVGRIGRERELVVVELVGVARGRLGRAPPPPLRRGRGRVAARAGQVDEQARGAARDGGDAAEATAFALRMLEMPPPAPPPEAEPAAEAEAEAAPAEPAPAP